MSNARVTRYVTEAVTLPRPDPTRPIYLTVASYLSRTDRIRTHRYLEPRAFGFGIGQI